MKNKIFLFLKCPNKNAYQRRARLETILLHCPRHHLFVVRVFAVESKNTHRHWNIILTSTIEPRENIEWFFELAEICRHFPIVPKTKNELWIVLSGAFQSPPLILHLTFSLPRGSAAKTNRDAQRKLIWSGANNTTTPHTQRLCLCLSLCLCL